MRGTMFETQEQLDGFAQGIREWDEAIRQDAARWKPAPGDPVLGDRVRHLGLYVEGTVISHDYFGFYVMQDNAPRADWMGGGILVRCDNPGNWEVIPHAIVVLPIRAEKIGPFDVLAMNEPTVTVIPGDKSRISFMGYMTKDFDNYADAYRAAKRLAERGELPN